MNEIKIAFFDIDGTVFDMDTKTVSDRMKETFRGCVRMALRFALPPAGHRFCCMIFSGCGLMLT